MKLLKKLAILTCALAAFSFVACDFGNSDDDEPNTPVVDGGDSAGGEEAGGATMKKFVVGITADCLKSGDSEPQVHYYGESSGRIKESQWADKNMKLNSENGIWTWESEELLSDGSETISVIIHSGDTKYLEDTPITIGKPMLYTRSEEFIEWDGISADTTEAYVEPEVPTEMSSEIIALALDVSGLEWKDDAPYIWAWGGNWVDAEVQTKYSPFYNKGWGSDDVKLTQLEDTSIWYFTFSKDYATEESITVQFISNEKLKDESDRITGALKGLEAGKGYLLKKDGTYTTFTSFAELKSE